MVIKNQRFAQLAGALQHVPTVFGENRTSERRTYLAESFAYGLNTREVTSTVANTGTVTTADSLLLVGSGTTTASTALARSKRALRYVPGHEGTCLFTARFTAGVAGTYQMVGPFGEDGGMGIGYNGTSFGVFLRRAGTDTWTASTAFNVYTNVPNDGNIRADGLPILDPTKLNIYGVTYAYLGIAPITFYWYAGSQYGWIPLHTIDLTNQQAGTHIDVPNLPMSYYVDNGATTSDMVIGSGSYNASVMASDKIGADRTNAVFGGQTSLVASQWQNVVTIKAATVFNSKTSYINTLVDYVSFANEGTKPVDWALFLNPTHSATLSYASVAASLSALDYATTASTVTAGVQLVGFGLGKADSDNRFIKELGVAMYPGDVLTLACRSAATSEVLGSVHVREEF